MSAQAPALTRRKPAPHQAEPAQVMADTAQAAVDVAVAIWLDDMPDGWAECLEDLSRITGVGRVYIGGYQAALPKRLPPAANDRLDCHMMPGIGFAELVEHARTEQAHPLLVLTEPYRLDRDFAAKAVRWLKTDPRFAVIGCWELSNDVRALNDQALQGAPRLTTLSDRLTRRLGALRPVPVTAVHRGIAVLGRSALDVAQGLDPTYDATPSLALVEFGFRVQRRGFQVVLEPSSIVRPLRMEPATLFSDRVRARLKVSHASLLEHFEVETRVVASPFNAARRVAQCAIQGLSLAICCDPDHGLSSFLPEFLASAVEDAGIRTIFLVAPHGLSHADWTGIPIHPKIVVARSTSELDSREIDVAIASASATLPASFLARTSRLIIEMHAGLPGDHAACSRLRQSTADAILVDNPKALAWLAENAPAIPADRTYSVPTGVRFTTGTPIVVEPQFLADLTWAGEQFALCIAPGFDGRLIDNARAALDNAGYSMRIVVLDALEGTAATAVTQRDATQATTIIAPLLTAGEKEWCRRHATIVMDYSSRRGKNLSRGLGDVSSPPTRANIPYRHANKADSVGQSRQNSVPPGHVSYDIDDLFVSESIDILLGIIYRRPRC